MTLAQFYGFLEAAGREERVHVANMAFAVRIAGATGNDYKKAIKELGKAD